MGSAAAAPNSSPWEGIQGGSVKMIAQEANPVPNLQSEELSLPLSDAERNPAWSDFI